MSWDHVRLGGMVFTPYIETDHEHLYRVHYALCSHAYLVSRSFAEAVCARRSRGLPFDAEINLWPQSQYMCEPMIALQSDDASDNVHSPGYSVLTPLREIITHRRCMALSRLIMFRARAVLALCLALVVYAVIRYRPRCTICITIL